MYQTNHVVVVDGDEIIAAVDDAHSPTIQLYNSDMIGGPVTLQFGNAQDPVEGLRLLDEFFEELHKVRVALLRRAGNAPSTAPRMVLVQHVGPTPDSPNWPVDHEEGE